ncbi:MAG: benzoyl-CoA-dihydrodiol lyase [Deltaproteobacteria bacterium]|nr:benzoyl-CoA-dihydrodiol lyase [Deltaproteobacteria bacterium]
MPPISFETHPSRYKHWKLKLDDQVATLALDVDEAAGLAPGYSLKLNSYDLGVDLELADALQRLRFEHPEVRALVLRSGKERIFCAGANIYMLGLSSHAFKVNFCKFTNETRLGLEDLSATSGIRSVCGVGGACAGGGYELALACDEIVLVDDGSSTVSLPEVPLLAVLPGTGGLTRLVDKRKVRRDLADFFCTTAEGVRGQRAVEWGLVDAVVPKSGFEAALAERARVLAAQSDRPTSGPGVALPPIEPQVREEELRYRHVTLAIHRPSRIAQLTVKGPEGAQPSTPEAILAAGASYWPLAAFRELDHALLHLRFNEPEIGTLRLGTEGDPRAVLAVDAALEELRGFWLVRELRAFIKRTLKRLDLTARSLIAVVEPGSCFAGTLLELALAADRTYMLDDTGRPTALALSSLNGGAYPMGNGLSRLETRFLGRAGHAAALVARAGQALGPAEALSAGLVTFAPDELDFEDEVRLALEERAALSPDALTGMEASLRFAGPETLETKIFGRLSAWQNWIFQRPNAVGERGALKVYGQPSARPELDYRRT